jgi:hypothetical protein
MFQKIAIANRSTVVTDDQLKPIVVALQKQVDNDFSKFWGMHAELVFVGLAEKPDPDAWMLGVFDNSDQAGALGYHDLTAQGQPLGKVFAQTDIAFGSSLSVTISHELLEMMADPDIDLCVFSQTSDAGGQLYAFEVCDAVEDDSLGYLIDGILVSDFVTPAWFETFAKTADFDFLHHVTAPFELAINGYIGIYPIPNSGGWSQQNGPTSDSRMAARRASLGSRRERRRTPRDKWVRSTVA